MVNVIYGAGIYANIFCKEMENNNIQVEYFIDEYTELKSLSNKKIKRLKDVSFDDIIIYISITSPMAEIEVQQTLKELGTKKVYTFIETLNLFPNLIPTCVKFTKTWHTDDLSKMIQMDKIKEFKSLLNDKKSIDLLDTIVEFRKNLIPENYPNPELEPQYFPSDINLFAHLDKIKFVDGGAYIGDTIVESIVGFENANKNIDYIASFEPDQANIKKLSEEVKKQKELYPDINFLIFSSGLWSSNEILEFSDNSGSSSSLVHIISENTIKIQTVELDKTLIGASPNYIKMDIEGAEKMAILGAKETIGEYSPVLAICLYHKPHDLWELPLLINKLNSNYNMYLRIYDNMGLELVLYCVPKSYNV